MKERLDFLNDPRASSALHEPSHWRFRAEEMRTIGGDMHDSYARAAMFRNADAYDRLAVMVEKYPIIPKRG